MAELQPKYRFELLLPLYDNAGQPIPPQHLLDVRVQLMERYGACRTQPSAPHLGWWQDPDMDREPAVYEDWALMFTVDTNRTADEVSWFADLKPRLLDTFQQLEIYLAVTEIFWL
jgi:hypothetical protein